jgi:ribonucleotide monophosphatase NagD (HAD superfamily)
VVLLDITGVLLESSSVTDTNLAIEGSVEAVQRLNDAGKVLLGLCSEKVSFRFVGIPVRFVTNETQRTRDSLVAKLHNNGYSMESDTV